MKRSPLACALVLATLLPLAAAAQTLPPGYPADYAAIVARQGGQGRLYSTAIRRAPTRCSGFSLYPGADPYHDLNSTGPQRRFLSETAAKAETADVLRSGAMDLQLKLVADSHATVYQLAEPRTCRNGRCEDRAWGTTFEPLVMATASGCCPRRRTKSHADLLRLLKKAATLRRRQVRHYDIEKSGFAFLR